MKPRPCELYRHFDKDGALIYVGISWCSLERLMVGHRNNSLWFPQIVRIEIEHFPSKADAVRAENSAIETERPLFNLQTPTKRGNGCLSEEVRTEKREWIRRAEAAGVKVRANACLSALKSTALAAEKGDYERARRSTAFSRLTRRISTNSPA